MNTGSHGEVQLENEHFRVTKWTIEPGGAIPMHRHEFAYVVVPITSGTLHGTVPSGETFITPLEPGKSYERPVGCEHRVENRAEEGAVLFVEVERLV